MSALLRRVRPPSWALVEPEIYSTGTAIGFKLPVSSTIAVRHFGKVRVILNEDVEGTGYKGERVTVRGGHMRNLLFPAKKAVYATKENVLVHEQTAEDMMKIEGRKALKAGRRNIPKIPITFKRHLEYAWVTPKEVTAQNVSDFLKKRRALEIAPENIDMERITALGEHSIRLRIVLSEDTSKLLREELGAEEFEKQSWVDTILTVVKR